MEKEIEAGGQRVNSKVAPNAVLFYYIFINLVQRV